MGVSGRLFLDSSNRGLPLLEDTGLQLRPTTDGPTKILEIRTGRAGKYGDTVAPGREDSASSDTSSLVGS
jgi:hypothetical protein